MVAFQIAGERTYSRMMWGESEVRPVPLILAPNPRWIKHLKVEKESIKRV
jgi:hypothetical protein